MFTQLAKDPIVESAWAVGDPAEITINSTHVCFVPLGGERNCSTLGAAVSKRTYRLGIANVMLGFHGVFSGLGLLVVTEVACMLSCRKNLRVLSHLSYAFLLLLFVSRVAVGGAFVATVRQDIQHASFLGDRFDVLCGSQQSAVCQGFDPFDANPNCSAPCHVVDLSDDPERTVVECEGFSSCAVRGTTAMKSCNSDRTDCSVHITWALWTSFAVDAALFVGTVVLGVLWASRSHSKLPTKHDSNADDSGQSYPLIPPSSSDPQPYFILC